MIHAVADNVRITRIVSAVPSHRIRNLDLKTSFTTKEVEDVVKMTGVEERRVSKPEQCTSDLCFAAAEELLTKVTWDRSSISALIFVSQTSDYILPATACVLQNRLNLKSSCIAFDINMGCSGYVYGLYVASQLIKKGGPGRVLLLVGDTCTKFVSPGDKSTCFLFGDAGTATVLEYAPGLTHPMKFSLGTDGAGWQNLIIPAGHFRMPATPDTKERVQGSDGNLRSKEDLYMNGGEIFNFTLSSVPLMVKEHTNYYGTEPSSIRRLVMHQANKFMLEHIRKKLKIPAEAVPYSIEKYGNTSCASIPVTICATQTPENDFGDSTLVGFGVGYSYAACTTNLDKITCSMVEID